VAAVARALPGRRAAHLRNGGWRGSLRAIAPSFTRCFDEEEKAQLWGPGAQLPSTDALVQSWYEGVAETAHPLEQMLQVWCATWLVEDLLMKADKMTMATSLELRCPFLDHTLVEWAGRLPLSWKVGDGRAGWQTKRILREFARRRLPSEILARRKQGFPDPACRWVASELAGWARERLLGRGSRIGELLRPAAVESALAAARGGEAAGHKAWVLICLEEWLRRWT
jgi:asparagine synthase (glutamine-hydrolysing)